MPFLPPNQQRQSTEGNVKKRNVVENVVRLWLAVKCHAGAARAARAAAHRLWSPRVVAVVRTVTGRPSSSCLGEVAPMCPAVATATPPAAGQLHREAEKSAVCHAISKLR